MFEEIHTDAEGKDVDLCIVHIDNGFLPSSLDLNDDSAQLFSQLELLARLKEKNLLLNGK